MQYTDIKGLWSEMEERGGGGCKNSKATVRATELWNRKTIFSQSYVYLLVL